MNAGDAPAASELFTRAILSKELSPERLALTYHHRGMAFHREGKVGRAILAYTTALWNKNLRRAFRPRVLNNRGLSYEAINDFASAMRDYNLALQLNDQYAEAYCNRGNLHRRFHRHEIAIADYDLALRNEHPYPKFVLVWQGMSLEALGKRREAMDAFRRALSLDPAFKLANSHLERLSASHALNNILGRRNSAKQPPPIALSPTPGGNPVANELDAAPWTPPAPAIVREPQAAAPVEREEEPLLRPAVDDHTRNLKPAPAALTRKPAVAATPPEESGAAPRPAPAAALRSLPDGEGGSGVDFALQLGSFKTKSLAEQGWISVLKIAGGLIGGLSHVIEPFDLPDRGPVYRLFAEALPDRDAALGLCRTLRDKGIPCIVVRR